MPLEQTSSPATRRWRPFAAEALAVAAVTALAAFLRLYRLGEIPFGLHGDEAIVALEAHSILDHGWIGPYVQISAGFPAGALYFIAPFIAVFGDTIVSVRAGMAALGIATIPVAYVAFRQAVSWRIALMSVALIAVSDWHIHLSRVAYLVVAWPFIEVVALAFLLAAFRTGRWYWYALAGIATAFSLYAYNAALLFIAAVVGLLALRLVAYRGIPRLRESLLYVILAASALLGARPMLDYASRPENDYFSHHNSVSIRARPEFEEVDSLREEVDFYAGRTRDYFQAIASRPRPDAADGLGVKPPIDELTAILAVIGACVALWRWRQPVYALALIAIAVMPLGSILTYEGIYRRTFGIVPFVMLLAGTTLGLLWERADRLAPWQRIPALALLAIVCGTIAYRNIDLYFSDFSGSQLERTTYFPEMTYLAEELGTLPDEAYLYQYSVRAGRGNEIRRFLAPGITNGIDRGGPWPFALNIDQPPPVVFGFLDAYIETMPRVMARYPGGEVTERRDDYGVLFRTYYFPPGLEIRGDGVTIEPTRALNAVPLGTAVPPPASCIPLTATIPVLTYFRYRPAADAYAVIRKEQQDPGGELLAIWKEYPDSALIEVGCATTGGLAAAERAADMPELGLTASAGDSFVIAVPSGDEPPEVVLWEAAR